MTSFVHALLHAADAPVEDFPFFPWRGQVQGVTVEDIPGIPPFPYRARLDELLAEPPRWPAPHERAHRGEGPHPLHADAAADLRCSCLDDDLDLDLIDYPGEWLLDLPMLTLDYEEWSARMEELANAGSRRRCPAPGWQQARRSIPRRRKTLPPCSGSATLYLDYLQRCRSERLSYLQPGRFLGGERVDRAARSSRSAGARGAQRPAPTARRWRGATGPIGSSFAASTARCSGGCAGRWCSSIC